MHSQLKKDATNNYSKGNMDAYPKDIHKTLTLMNKYKPLKLDAQVVPAQGITAFVTGSQGSKGRKGENYLQDAEWNALSPEAKSKIIEAHKKGAKVVRTMMTSLLRVQSWQRLSSPSPRQ
jgi:hypothetical protein